MVSSREESQPPQDGGDGDNVNDWPWLGLIQLLRSAATSALASLPPPGLSCRPKLECLHAVYFDYVCINLNVERLQVCTCFMRGMHMFYKLLLIGTTYAFSLPARRIVVEAIDGIVAVHQN